ncbi:MAG TPA: cupredoxin domain-containing protein [Kineosporiaceae bacterium]
MRHRLWVASAALATFPLSLSACGSGPGPTSTTPGNTGGAATSGAAAGGAAAGDSGAAAAQPADSMAEEAGGGGNDGDEAKIPQGMPEAKAVAAGLGKDGAPVVSVTGTETTCVPDRTSVPAGKVWFKFTNQGTRISELYLESPDAKELVEVEKIKKGAGGAFRTTVKPGSYLVACEPGMADKQIRTAITVTG